MNAWPVAALPRALGDFMADALEIEQEAVQRYRELADVMTACNNTEVAALFRQMAVHEEEHVRAILERMRWREAPRTHRPGAAPSPEAVAPEGLHYLMKPWHALQLALQAERRAEAYFARVAESADNADIRAAARRMQQEEAEHVALVAQWLRRVPEPPPGWDDDPDPPRYTD